MFFRSLLAFAALACAATAAEAERADLTWRPWSPSVFVEAKAENRLVLLDLEAVWCHWCHVMAETTYGHPEVVELLKSKFVTVRVDQDAHPDLSARYGDWGWPATIIFAADGTEIVKRRGYIEPVRMISMLEAIISDPTPGPSVIAEADVVPSDTPLLTPADREMLLQRQAAAYDAKYGGWGRIHKFIDADSMDWELERAGNGDAQSAVRARQTLDAALNLIDREDGGIYQYSDTLDWLSPHYEKIMAFQANALRSYAAAYNLWKDKKHLVAIRSLRSYLLETLLGPGGAFFTSQDADAGKGVTGKVYYGLSREERAKLGQRPRIDTNIYARENGWAISGLAADYAATGHEASLAAAVRAARWIEVHRALPDGGYRHGDADRAGPYLGDTLAMGRAALDLYAATGDRTWLQSAAAAGRFIATVFMDPDGGFRTAAEAEAPVGVLAKPVRSFDEQVQVTRFANLLFRYTGDSDYQRVAEHGGRYLTSSAVLDQPFFMPGVLLADAELSREPTHITIVGAKDDARAVALHRAGRAYPSVYKRLDWWDRSEGALMNPDVTYPDLGSPAAFACTNRICSLPVFAPAELAEAVQRMMRAPDG